MKYRGCNLTQTDIRHLYLFALQFHFDWSQSISDFDRQLYAKYGLSDDEIAYIEKMIKPME